MLLFAINIDILTDLSCLHVKGRQYIYIDLQSRNSKDISNPCYFHYQYLHCNSAGHHIKPNLSHMLRLCYRCCNGGNDNNCGSNASNQIRDADQREYSRRTASINRVLNCLVKSVPCRRKAAYRKSICQKKQTSASPVIDICPVCYGSSSFLFNALSPKSNNVQPEFSLSA